MVGEPPMYHMYFCMKITNVLLLWHCMYCYYGIVSSREHSVEDEQWIMQEHTMMGTSTESLMLWRSQLKTNRA